MRMPSLSRVPRGSSLGLNRIVERAGRKDVRLSIVVSMSEDGDGTPRKRSEMREQEEIARLRNFPMVTVDLETENKRS